MSRIPGNVEVDFTGRRVRLSDLGIEADAVVVSDSSNADTGTPSWRLRPGNVLVKRTGTGRYVEANDANGDRNTAPIISSSGFADGSGLIKLVGNHGTISVTTVGSTGTVDENVAELNADAVFGAHYVASNVGGELTISARNAGSDEWFYVHPDTMASAGFSMGVDYAVYGTDADYVVTLQFTDQQDSSGNAVHSEVKVARIGHFDESNLINLTGEARAVLSRRGSIFG